jgi:hypothetical protein
LQPFPIDLETTISANGRKNPMISTAAFFDGAADGIGHSEKYFVR